MDQRRDRRAAKPRTRQNGQRGSAAHSRSVCRCAPASVQSALGRRVVPIGANHPSLPPALEDNLIRAIPPRVPAPNAAIPAARDAAQDAPAQDAAQDAPAQDATSQDAAAQNTAARPLRDVPTRVRLP